MGKITPKVAEFTDQMQRTIRISRPPQRIVSLVPSQTELLHYLGLDREVVGITRFCEHPTEWFRNKTRSKPSRLGLHAFTRPKADRKNWWRVARNMRGAGGFLHRTSKSG